MKRTLILILLAVISFSCQRAGRRPGDKLLVTVSILPQKYFIEQIAGNLVDVNVLIAKGMSHEDYSPTPRQLQEIEKSTAYIQIGELGFEKIWVPKIASMNSRMKIYNCSEGINYLRFAGESNHEVEHSSENSEYGGYDPHTWMSPKCVKMIAANVFKELKELLPSHKQELEKNYTAFINRIDNIIQMADQKLGNRSGHKFMIFHPALGYLAHDYGLEQISLEHEGKEPSTRHLKAVIDQAKASGIKVIFVQKEFSMSQSQTVSKEIGGKVIQIDPMDYNWENQMKGIIVDLSDALNR
ncbi:MAG: zinc ABC transporter substrate-binding protein [Bacteroidota bacterium]|nr:zinc ABC transporter substrate-binding protein [Bacteroidota bacterium]